MNNPRIFTLAVNGTTAPATFTTDSAVDDDALCCAVEKRTASDLSGLITRLF